MVLNDPDYSSHIQPLKLKIVQLRLKMEFITHKSSGVINFNAMEALKGNSPRVFPLTRKKFEPAFGVLQSANAWSGVVSLEYIARWLIKKCGF